MKILNYRVEIGDNMGKICKFFHITENEFNSLNKNISLTAGTVVHIPLKQKCVVIPCDRLHDLAKKLLITQDELKQKFGDTFFIGELLEL